MEKFINFGEGFFKYFIAAVFIIFIYVTGNISDVLLNRHHFFLNSYFMPILWITILFVFIYFLIYKNILTNLTTNKIILIIFIMALIPRILFLIFVGYSTPSNDFATYYRMGVETLRGNFEFAANASFSHFRAHFGGLAVYNALIARIFGTTPLGFAISNIITASLTSVFMYLIMKPYNEKVGIIAALIWAIYPSNVMSVGMVTNFHPAVLHNLISIYFITKIIQTDSNKKLIIYSVLAVIFAVISQFAHNAGFVYFLATVCFLLILLIVNKNKKYIKVTAIYIIGFYCLFNLGLFATYRVGIIKSMDSTSNLRSMIIGLDTVNPGYLANNQNLALLNSFPREERKQVARDIVIQTLRNNPSQILTTYKVGITRTWFANDNNFSSFVRDLIDLYHHSNIDKTIEGGGMMNKNIKGI